MVKSVSFGKQKQKNEISIYLHAEVVAKEFGRCKSDGDIGAVAPAESCIGILADTVVEDTIAVADCILDDAQVRSFVGGDHNGHNIVGDVDAPAVDFGFVGDTFDAGVVDHHA